MRATIVVLMGLVLAWTSGGLRAAGVELFVATVGNDAWSGRLAEPNAEKTDGPFRTLERARDEIRKQKAAGGGAAQGGKVVVRGGFNALDKTFTLEAQDSGTAEGPVVYEAAPGEKVVLAGGPIVPAEAFAPVADAKVEERLDPAARGKVMQANLRALGIAGLDRLPVKFQGAPEAPELFFGQERMTLARWPNGEWATIAKIVASGSVPREGDQGTEGGVFEYSGDRPSRWNVETGVWLHGYWAFDWFSEVIQVKSIDREKQQITLAVPSVYGVRQRNPSPRRYYAMNLLEELDSPGEYFIDGKAGLLYFWPPAPLAEKRVVLSTLKAPVVAVKEASSIRLRGFTVEASLSDAIQVSGGSDVRIQACEVCNTRGLGIRVSGGKSHAVEACDIHDTGTGGIVLAGGDRKTLTPAGHEAANNHIWRFSIHKPTSSYALMLEGVGNRGAHNLIHDAPHQAIGIGGNDHVFEYNIVHHVCMETDDCGAFYKGRNPSCRGNVIRYNFWHNIGSPMGHGNAAIYFDDGDGGDVVFGNVFFRCGEPGKGSFGTVFSHGGHDILAENNVFIDCKRALGSAPWNDQRWKAAIDGGEDCNWQERLLKEVDITRPPYTTRYPALVGFMNPQPGQPRVSRAVRNVIAMCADLKNGNWEASPEENWVTEGDPGFVNAAEGDFRLKPDSEVFTKLPGFQPIPLEKMGLVEDELRPVVSREAWTYGAKAEKSELKKLRQEAAHRPRRVIYNDDGCHETPGTTAEAWLGCRLKQVANTQVDTICYCTGGGGVFWAHQPKVGEVLGQWVEEGHDAYVKQMRDTLIALKKEGTDPLAVVVDYGHKNHMEVFWSCRMNNPECTFVSWGRSAKKRNNPALIMGVAEDWKKYPPTDPRAWYTLWDYENPEVRDDLVLTIEDLCQRYEIDGIELDFIRHPLFFRPNLEGKPAEPRQVAMMTDMVRRIRAVTERESVRRGRPILVTVRAPLSVESCMNIGLDIRAYFAEDLMDILIAGQDYIQMAVASSLKDMVDLGHQYQVPVYALLVPPKPYDRYRYDNRAWWGAAMNRWYWGADGIYLFNLFPSEPDERFSQLGSVETLKGRDKIYAIDNPAQEDVLGTFKMVMVGPDRLPISLAAQEEATARLPVGEDIVANTPAGKSVSTLLRLRLAGMARGDTLQVTFNGQPLAVAGPVEPLAATPSDAWFHIPADPKLVKPGYNTIGLQLKTSRAAAPVVVDALDLVVSYADLKAPSR